jgi:hypothetical protein
MQFRYPYSLRAWIASALAGVFLSTAALAQAPANDDCSGATPLVNGVNAWNNTTATNSVGAPAACATIGRDIWFTYTATCTGNATITLCGQTPTVTLDTVLQVFTATSTCGTLTQLACNDQGPCGNPSEVTFPVTSGSTYRVRLGSFSTILGSSGNLTVSCAAPPPPPANDTCANAVVIGSVPYTAPAASVAGQSATADVDVTCNTGSALSTTAGVWFTYTPALTGSLNLTQTSANDTVVAVFTGGCGSPVQIACSDPNSLSVPVTAGVQYWILVGMWGTVNPTTNYGLTVDLAVPPANDTCANAIPLTLNTPVAGTTAGATNDYQLSGATAFQGLGHLTSTAPGRDVVYSFTAPAAGTYSFRVNNYAQNAVLYTASGCPSGTAPITVTTALLAANRTSTGVAEEILCQTLTAGQQVFVYVDDSTSANAGASFVLEVNECVRETEPNGTPAQANPFTFGMEGSITPAAEADFFSLGTPAAGSRLFAMADGAAASSNDFDLRVTNLTSTLEYDDGNNDTAFGGLAPNVGGTILDGTASFLRLSHFSSTTQSEPYRLYAVVQPPLASAAIEAEPNDAIATASTSPLNYFSGATASSLDTDLFSFSANAGQLIYLGLDNDPLRNNTPINGALALLNSAGTVLVSVNDTGSTSSTTSGAGSLTATTPNSPAEGLTFRVLTTGTYFARVTAASAGDYLLSIAVLPQVGPSYCPADSLACNSATDAFLSNVTLAAVNNGSTSGAGCYTDFTALTANLQASVGAPISVTVGNYTGTQNVTVYADWDQDGTLGEPGEEYLATGGPVFTANIVPPGSATLGNTRLRVRVSGDPVVPCGTLSDGETEDYRVFVSAPPAAPVNDLCVNASVIGNGATNGTTLLAGNDGSSSCDPSGRDVWFSYTATLTGNLSLNTCGSAIDTAIAVYSACGGTELGCNDDCGGSPCGPTGACLSVPITSGTTYRIRVSDKGLGASGGAFTLNVSAAIPNDNCSGATLVAVPTVVNGTMVGATVESGLPTCTGPGPNSIAGGSFVVSGLGVWYRVNVPVSQTITADTISGAGFDSRLSVYTGSCGSLSCVTVNDDIVDVSFRSKVAWVAQAGVDYFVLVSTFSATTTPGPFTLTLSAAPTPSNDDCATATVIGPGAGNLAGTTIGATGAASTLTAAGVASCATNTAVPIFDVWYSFTAPCTASYSFNTCGSYDTLLSVHTACPTTTNAFQLAPTGSSCNDNGGLGCSPGSQVTVSLVQGTTYLVRIAGAVGAAAGGNFTLSWTVPDQDGDGAPDCLDGCPLDPNKVGPGACGCGVADTDSDGDGTADCNDLCPNDPNKVAPGVCGCGVADTDSDGDGTPDCNDLCPNDPNKIAPGACGCGVADTDSDGDGTPDCLDACPADPAKVNPGVCGCGVADTDSDGDGTPDCNDQCPTDPNKVAPGVCGCGVADTDSDGDGTPDCNDLCPNDPAKVAPGVCGCGVADTDSDGDGTPDCNDLCPNDPNKVAPGACGCGFADVDTDGDGTLDCVDGCPNDPAKIAPGVCGCGVAETDGDGDGTPDCIDQCPTDPTKIVPGLCGCLVPEGCSLGIDINTISLSQGGEQQLFLYAGPQYALSPYFILGSVSGTSPGLPLGGSITLPLNFDLYTDYTLANPNSFLLPTSLGVLNFFGLATSKVNVPNSLSLLGLPLTVHHAYVVLDTNPLAVVFASNPVPLVLVP